jgi:hypothetical protein
MWVCMKEIITGVKRNDGIITVWQDGKEMKSSFFEYSDLIDMKINALDLLDHPKMYLFDPDKNLIVMK